MLVVEQFDLCNLLLDDKLVCIVMHPTFHILMLYDLMWNVKGLI